MMDKYQQYKNTAFSAQQWFTIKKAIDEDVKVEDIANPRISEKQMELLINARKDGIDIQGLIDPDLKPEQLKRILDKIYNEMGVYDAKYEDARGKWIRNMTCLAILVGIIASVISVLFATKDDWMKYFEDLYLKFNTQLVELEAGDRFDPALYIKSYDPEAKIEYPNLNEVNTKKPGSYWAIYHITNGKKEKDMKLLIKVKDTKKPVIKLKTNYIEVEAIDKIKPSDYVESVEDNVDGNLLKDLQINITNDHVFYSVKDASGNLAKEFIKVRILSSPTPSKGTNESSVTTPNKQDLNQQKNNSPTKPEAPNPGTVQAQGGKYPFVEGKTFDQTYQECMQAGQVALNVGKANTATCTVYDENGIHKGYILSFN